MKAIKLLKYQKYAKVGRAARLRGIIERYVSGRYGDAELRGELERLYGEVASGEVASGENVLGEDKLYQEVYRLIKESYPKGGDLRVDQIESYTNTVSARAATTERLSEYAGRGVQMVQVVAYLDHATTEVCRMMHGRVFAVGDARDSLGNQDMLVNPESFWKGNDYFGQVASADMKGWMPPYHYNCRTRVVPYIEPADLYDAAIDRHSNLIKLEEAQIQALVDKALSFEYASSELLHQHFLKHHEEYEVSSDAQYMRIVRDLLKNPLKQMGLAISPRDGGRNLYVWDPRVRVINNKAVHDFAVFSLDKKCLKTFYPKIMDKIMQNLDSNVHGKVMLLTDQYTSKGVSNMVVELEVKQYEYIIDYFETDDSTDEQEMFNRLGMEEEWDGIPEALKQRILAVDKIVLERYADLFDYNVFNKYIKCIRKRQELEG